jgi:hypothetical protein
VRPETRKKKMYGGNSDGMILWLDGEKTGQDSIETGGLLINRLVLHISTPKASPRSDK